MIKFYISDLDGTLLNDRAELSRTSIETLNTLIKSGIYFTVASARSLHSIQTIMKEVDLRLPVVCFNGAFVSDVNEMRHLVINHIEEDLSLRIYNKIKPFAGMLISTFLVDDQLFYDDITSEGMLSYINDRQKAIGEPLIKKAFDKITQHIMAFTVIDTKEKILKIQNVLKSTFGETIKIEAWEDMYYKPWYWLTVHSRSATKAEGIKTLFKLMDLQPEQVIVFGDNTNDLSMFQLSDQSFAVSNAVEILKAHADEIIEHHNENGVVKKIRELEKNGNI